MNKRIIKFIKFFACLVIFGSIVAVSLAEPFVIRNSITFGMSEDEVIKAEERNGIGVEPSSKDLTGEFQGYRFINYFSRDLLGFSKVNLRYFFFKKMNNGMYYLEYEFNDKTKKEETFIKLSSALESKYGSPNYIYPRDNMCVFTEKHIISILQDVMDKRGFRSADCRQWLKAYDDCYVLISVLYTTKSNPYMEKGYSEECYLFYNYVSKKQVEEYLAEIEDQERIERENEKILMDGI